MDDTEDIQREPKIKPGSIENVQTQQDKLRRKYSQDTTTFYEAVEEKYHNAPAGGRAMHWFLWAYTPKGRAVTLGPFASESDVEQKIAEEGLQEEVIRQYPTIQLTKATQMLRLEIDKPIDDVIGRVKHQKSLTREAETKHKRKKRFGIF